jgi:hypothetical protein
VSNSKIGPHQPFEHPGEIMDKALGLLALPLVEIGTVAQGESCQEFSSVELHRVAEWRNAARTDFMGRMAMRTARRQSVAKVGHVYPDRCVGGRITSVWGRHRLPGMHQADYLPIRV